MRVKNNHHQNTTKICLWVLMLEGESLRRNKIPIQSQDINFLQQENNKLTMQKPKRHHPNQEIKISVINNKIYRHHVHPDIIQCEGHHFGGILAKNPGLNLIMRNSTPTQTEGNCTKYLTRRWDYQNGEMRTSI